MLTTIQELEHEIDQFHKNIKDSNELMKILMSVASLTKTQTESFEVCTKALQDELTKLPPELSKLLQKKIEGFVQTLHDEHQLYQTAVAKLMDEYADRFVKAESFLSEMPSALEAQLQKDHSEHVAGLKQIQEQYAADLSRASEQLEAKYDAFVAKLEATNMDQLYRCCQDMNKSINTKLGLTLGGVAVAIIVAIISLFIQEIDYDCCYFFE